MISCEEGFVSVQGGKVYYIKYSSERASGVPLILIHGGPGFAHYYLEALHALADERPVVLYDQLGCGQSDRPSVLSYCNVPRFVEELVALVSHLQFETVSLLGHSWGSTIAAEYYFSGKPVSQLIFASPFLSVKLWNQDAQRNIAQLPSNLQQAITNAREAKDFSSAPFMEAHREYYARHVYRHTESNSSMQRSTSEAGRETYLTMWGPNEFTVTGSLQNYDCFEKLSTIKVPTLFTCGKYDEATPQSCKQMASRIANAESISFKESGHFPHIGEKQEYLKAVRDFLSGKSQPKPGLLQNIKRRFFANAT